MPTKNFKNNRILLRIPNFVIFPDKMPSLGVYKRRYTAPQYRRYAVWAVSAKAVCGTVFWPKLLYRIAGITGGTVFKGTLVICDNFGLRLEFYKVLSF
jgi:hypothetical protein